MKKTGRRKGDGDGRGELKHTVPGLCHGPGEWKCLVEEAMANGPWMRVYLVLVRCLVMWSDEDGQRSEPGRPGYVDRASPGVR